MSDFAAKLDEARRKLPLRTLMDQRGKGPGNGNWKSFPKCPYCGHESSAGVFTPTSGSSELFKCFHQPCPTNNEAWDEVAFLAFELNLNRKDAAVTFLKEAGVWKDKEAYAPSVLPGAKARKFNAPSDHEDEGLVRECIEVVRAEQKASVTLLQRRLQIREYGSKADAWKQSGCRHGCV